MLVHKGGQINNVQLITGFRIAEMSQRQGGGGICTKKGSYCEKEKKSGGGQGRCEWRSEAFVKIQKKKKKIFFFGGGSVIVKRKKSQVGGQGRCEWRSVRMDVNGEVKLL